MGKTCAREGLLPVAPIAPTVEVVTGDLTQYGVISLNHFRFSGIKKLLAFGIKIDYKI
jgi:hypothetical protein